jgi:hypothetical protein
MMHRQGKTSGMSKVAYGRATHTSALSFGLCVALLLYSQPTSIFAGSSPLVPETFFGLHIHHIGTITPWPKARFAEWRLWDAYVAWPNLEPARGHWHFENLDRYVWSAEQHDANILLPLGLTPRWASARPNEPSSYQPGNAAEPRDIEDWRTYVRTVAQRYKSRIHNYEIWNEPNLRRFWTGDVKEMVALTREAVLIIRAIDPHATIVSPSATTASGTTWLLEFLVAGGGQYVDVIGYHLYVMPNPPEDILPLIQKVKKIMLDNSAGNKPLWDTETGWALPKPFPSEELGAAYLARTHLLGWSGGVQKLYWYSWDNHAWVTIQTTEKDNKTLTPAGRAYETIYKWMVGATLEKCAPSGENWICELDRNGLSEWIVWNPERSESFIPPAQWHAKFVVSLQGVSQALGKSGFQAGPSPALVTSTLQ